jgi:hypothetical protein
MRDFSNFSPNDEILKYEYTNAIITNHSVDYNGVLCFTRTKPGLEQ